MLRLAVLAFLLGACSAFIMPPKIPINTNQPPPPPCCLPVQWEGNIHLIEGMVMSGQTELRNVTARQSYDYTHKMIATEVLGQHPARIIQDYNKMMQYDISEGHCKATKLAAHIDNCAFMNATHLGSFYFGGVQGLMVDGYQLMDTPFGRITVDVTRNGCIPVTEVITSKSGATTPSIRALGFVDITLGIRNPAVFNVPHPLCPSQPDKEEVGKTKLGFGFEGF